MVRICYGGFAVLRDCRDQEQSILGCLSTGCPTNYSSGRRLQLCCSVSCPHQLWQWKTARSLLLLGVSMPIPVCSGLKLLLLDHDMEVCNEIVVYNFACEKPEGGGMIDQRLQPVQT
jgi:hypothetical protein